MEFSRSHCPSYNYFFPLSLTANYFFEKSTLYQFVSPNILYACIKQWYDLYEHPFTWFALTWLEKVNSGLQVFAFITFLFPDFHCRLTDRLKKKNKKKSLIAMNLSSILASVGLNYAHCCAGWVGLWPYATHFQGFSKFHAHIFIY